MIRRRVSRRTCSLGSRQFDVDVIGGKADVTLRRFSFRADGNTLSSDMAPVAVPGSYDAKDAEFSEYLPALGCTLIINANGRVLKWDTAQKLLFIVGTLPVGTPFLTTSEESGYKTYTVYSGNKAYKIKSYGNELVNLPYTLGAGIYHCGRVFAADATDGYTLRWSGLGGTNWALGIEGGGYVKLDHSGGKIIDVKGFGDNILCLREYSITIIHALADSRNFRISPSQKLIPVPAVNAGGAVIVGKYWFSCNDGLYTFDGNSVKKAFAVPASRQGTFGRVKSLSDGYVYAEFYCPNRITLRYDPQTGEYVWFGYTCSLPWKMGNDYYCVYGSLIKKLERGAADSYRQWQSESVDGGVSGMKTLRSITVEKDSGINVYLLCNGKTRLITGTGEITLCDRAESFVFRITGSGNIKKLSARLEVTK